MWILFVGLLSIFNCFVIYYSYIGEYYLCNWGHEICKFTTSMKADMIAYPTIYYMIYYYHILHYEVISYNILLYKIGSAYILVVNWGISYTHSY